MNTTLNKIEAYGFTQAMDGEELWVNTLTDERIVVCVKNHDARWGLYCKPVKITIEEISEEELQEAQELAK